MTYGKTQTYKHDIHQEITDNIIKLLDEVDFEDYQPPFASLVAQGLPVNPTTQHRYQGVNILALWSKQKKLKFSSNQWASFKQWKDHGAQVRKGEKGSRVVFYKTLVKSQENENGEQEDQKIPMLRLYTVFNAAQVDGYKDQSAQTPPETDKVKPMRLVDEFCRKTGADIRTVEDEAYYLPSGDYINMPGSALFLETPQISATEQYYSTLLHELTHWTGAKKRLDRPGITNRKERAFEELIAELGAAFLCSQHGLAQTQPKNHAIYIKSWLQALKQDKTHIFKASAQAAKAVEFLNDPTILQAKLEPA